MPFTRWCAPSAAHAVSTPLLPFGSDLRMPFPPRASHTPFAACPPCRAYPLLPSTEFAACPLPCAVCFRTSSAARGRCRSLCVYAHLLPLAKRYRMLYASAPRCAHYFPALLLHSYARRKPSSVSSASSLVMVSLHDAITHAKPPVATTGAS